MDVVPIIIEAEEGEGGGGGGEKMKSEAASAETRIQPHSCSLATVEICSGDKSIHGAKSAIER